MTIPRLTLASSSVALLMGVACSRPDPEPAPTIETAAGDVVIADSAAGPTVPPSCGENILVLPQGFCSTVFADSIPAARHMAVAPNGDVFVNVSARRGAQGGPPVPGTIVALRDANNDGAADTTARFGQGGGTGIALHNGYLYADEGRRIVRYPLAAGSLTPSGDPQVVLDSMPTGGHGSRPFVIDRDGNLYVNIGSRSNACQQQDRQPGSPGADPCTELETRAGIWKYSANRTGQIFSARERFATGIRNANGLDLHPQTGQLWITQHGRDGLFQQWASAGYDERESAENPAEELLEVGQGDDFGWPYCFYSVDDRKRVLAPEYGGKDDVDDDARCARFEAPAATFPGHWAPNDLLFYTGTMFPARYRGGAFIAFHGSWNRAPLPQAGFNVVFQPLSNGRVAGQYEVFADASPGEDTGPVRYRPTGLAQMPDGSLLVSADVGGRIWKVMYRR